MVYSAPSRSSSGSTMTAHRDFSPSISGHGVHSRTGSHSPPQSERYAKTKSIDGSSSSSSSQSPIVARQPLQSSVNGAIMSANPILTIPVPPKLKLPMRRRSSSSTVNSDQSTLSLESESSAAPQSGQITYSMDENRSYLPGVLSNLPRRRSSQVSESPTTSGVLARGAGLRLNISDIANKASSSSSSSSGGNRKDKLFVDETAALHSAPAEGGASLQLSRGVRQRLDAAAEADIRGWTYPGLSAGHSPTATTPFTITPSTPSHIRKKSGELVKSSLRRSKHSTPQTPVGDGMLLSPIDTVGLGYGAGSKSEPTTPTSQKSVHFDVKLEHVKHFLAKQKPLAVSRDGSPTETSEGGEDFFSYGASRASRQWSAYGGTHGSGAGAGASGSGAGASSHVSRSSTSHMSSEDEERLAHQERVRSALEIHLSNWPKQTALERLKANWEGPDAEHVRMHSLELSEDHKNIKGSVILRNLAFQKTVAIRFTMDRWNTTSEVAASYVGPVRVLAVGTASEPEGAYERWEFTLRLEDYIANRILERTLQLAVRYACNGEQLWDNNGGQNYLVSFKQRRSAAFGSSSSSAMASGGSRIIDSNVSTPASSAPVSDAEEVRKPVSSSSKSASASGSGSARFAVAPTTTTNDGEVNDDDDDDDTEEMVGRKLAILKNSLEKVVKNTVTPRASTHLRSSSIGFPSSSSAAANPISASSSTSASTSLDPGASSSSSSSGSSGLLPTNGGAGEKVGTPTQTSFVNSRSAADVLLRLGRQSQNAVSSPSGSGGSGGVRRQREYDIGFSLKNAALFSPGRASPVPAPPSQSTASSSSSGGNGVLFPRQGGSMPFGAHAPGQSFRSSTVLFPVGANGAAGGGGAGSPRDTLTPGRETSHFGHNTNANNGVAGNVEHVLAATTPGGSVRTLSESDLSPSFQHLNQFGGQGGLGEVGPVRSNSDSMAREYERSYFAFGASHQSDFTARHAQGHGQGGYSAAGGSAAVRAQSMSDSVHQSVPPPQQHSPAPYAGYHGPGVGVGYGPGGLTGSMSPRNVSSSSSTSYDGNTHQHQHRYHSFPPVSPSGSSSLGQSLYDIAQSGGLGRSTSDFSDARPAVQIQAQTNAGGGAGGGGGSPQTSSPSLTTDSTATNSPLVSPVYLASPHTHPQAQPQPSASSSSQSAGGSSSLLIERSLPEGGPTSPHPDDSKKWSQFFDEYCFFTGSEPVVNGGVARRNGGGGVSLDFSSMSLGGHAEATAEGAGGGHAGLDALSDASGTATPDTSKGRSPSPAEHLHLVDV